MRIALIHYRLIHKGGLETRLKNYIWEFRQRGHEVTVVCARYLPSIELPSGTKVIRLSPGLTPKPFRKWRFSGLVRQYLLRNKFDFSLSLGRTTGQDAVLAPANHMGYMKAMEKKFWGISDLIQHHLDKISFQRSKIIFAASKMMKDELTNYYNIPSGKIKVLFPPVNVSKYSGIQLADIKIPAGEPAFDEGKTSFFFVSISHKRKGLDILLEVFSNLRDEPFELFIAGYPKVRTDLPNVRYIGFREDLRPWFASADFTIHPARFEPFGQVITESLACGTPVLVSGKVGAKEILEKGEGIILNSLDPKDWINLIRGLKHEEFSVAPEAILKRGLGLDRHISRMLEEWDNIR